MAAFTSAAIVAIASRRFRLISKLPLPRRLLLIGTDFKALNWANCALKLLEKFDLFSLNSPAVCALLSSPSVAPLQCTVEGVSKEINELYEKTAGATRCLKTAGATRLLVFFSFTADRPLGDGESARESDLAGECVAWDWFNWRQSWGKAVRTTSTASRTGGYWKEVKEKE